MFLIQGVLIRGGPGVLIRGVPLYEIGPDDYFSECIPTSPPARGAQFEVTCEMIQRSRQSACPACLCRRNVQRGHPPHPPQRSPSQGGPCGELQQPWRRELHHEPDGGGGGGRETERGRTSVTGQLSQLPGSYYTMSCNHTQSTICHVCRVYFRKLDKGGGVNCTYEKSWGVT